MAEYLLKAMIRQRDDLKLENWQIISAGISAVKGAEANDKVKNVMAELGIELEGHISHSLADIELEEQDLIITMTRKHSRALVLDYPNLSDKVFTLKELSGLDSENKDIQDPFGLSEAVYRATRDEIKANLEFLLENLKKFDLSKQD